MKVLAQTDSSKLLVEMKVGELRNLAGFYSDRDFDKAFGCDSSTYQNNNFLSSLKKVENIPVGELFKEAHDTLDCYEELRTKFESIRNQLTTLMKKMVQAKPAPKED